MNIICNNCVGSRIYQIKNIKYNNPFMWCRIYPKDMILLINEYDNINFENIKIIKKYNELDNTVLYGLNIDNIVDVYYPHYKSIIDKNNKKSYKTTVDVYSDDVEKYIIDKYIERIKRMNEPPIFIVTKNFTFDKKDFENLIETIKCKYTVIVASDFDFENSLKQKVTYVNLRKGEFMTMKTAKKIEKILKL